MPRNQHDDAPRAPRLLRLRDVLARTGLSKSAVYSRIDAGTFPRPVSLGARAVAWRERDLSEWIESREPAPVRAIVSPKRPRLADAGSAATLGESAACAGRAPKPAARPPSRRSAAT